MTAIENTLEGSTSSAVDDNEGECSDAESTEEAEAVTESKDRLGKEEEKLEGGEGSCFKDENEEKEDTKCETLAESETILENLNGDGELTSDDIGDSKVDEKIITDDTGDNFSDDIATNDANEDEKNAPPKTNEEEERPLESQSNETLLSGDEKDSDESVDVNAYFGDDIIDGELLIPGYNNFKTKAVAKEADKKADEKADNIALSDISDVSDDENGFPQNGGNKNNITRAKNNAAKGEKSSRKESADLSDVSDCDADFTEEEIGHRNYGRGEYGQNSHGRIENRISNLHVSASWVGKPARAYEDKKPTAFYQNSKTRNDEYSRSRGDHSRTWDEHSRTWDEHPRTWDDHSRTRDDHSRTRDGYSKNAKNFDVQGNQKSTRDENQRNGKNFDARGEGDTEKNGDDKGDKVEEEKSEGELEEGELSDEGDKQKYDPKQRSVCKFYSRGLCTWGDNCRFIHPGVPDKGNYSMFDTRPVMLQNNKQTPNALQAHPQPLLQPLDRPPLLPAKPFHHMEPLLKANEQAETAWERGLRQAKEMIRKSSQRKEEDFDFEDKKMNLSFGGGMEERERPRPSHHPRQRHIPTIVLSSPESSPNNWKSKEDDDKQVQEQNHHQDQLKAPLPIVDTHYPPPPISMPNVPPPTGYMTQPPPPRPDMFGGPPRLPTNPYEEYAMRMGGAPIPGPFPPPPFHYLPPPNPYFLPPPPIRPMGGQQNANAPPHGYPQQPPYDQKLSPSKYGQRDEMQGRNSSRNMERSPPHHRKSRRDRSISRSLSRTPPPRREREHERERKRGDEWSDPWMRTNKSPGVSRRRQRYSRSSSSSGSSSGGSSSGSSRSGSFSPPKPRAKLQHAASAPRIKKKQPIQFKLSPTSRSQLPAPRKAAFRPESPTVLSERRAETERSFAMNPPPPSPKMKLRGLSPRMARIPSVAAVLDKGQSKAKPTVPARLLAHSKATVAAAMRSARSVSKSSSKSDSGSSSSSSDSGSESESESDSSSSSDGNSRPVTPPARHAKRNLHAAVKNKSLDALQMKGQKRQIKLTLKNPDPPKGAEGGVTRGGGAKVDPKVAKKRAHSTSGSSGSSDSSDSEKGPQPPKAAPKKPGAPSRREELLKQLKAVEDAIARKRSKIT